MQGEGRLDMFDVSVLRENKAVSDSIYPDLASTWACITP